MNKNFYDFTEEEIESSFFKFKDNKEQLSKKKTRQMMGRSEEVAFNKRKTNKHFRTNIKDLEYHD